MPRKIVRFSNAEFFFARRFVRASNKEECPMRIRRLLAIFALVALATPFALAQTTGSVSGVVRSPEGEALPGVTVAISGEKLPLGRSMVTLSDGSFQFIGLLPGDYRVKAELPGLGSFEQNAVVSIAKDTEVRPVLRATATAAVEVSAAIPLVDTKASDISQVTTSETIRKLPLGGSYTATFQLAAGVPENTTTAVSAPNAGGGRQDNTFLYDGVNVTNPFFGDLYQDFAGYDIQEVNITRGGVSAEYGRTGGFLVNAVTKSGTNSLHGGASVEYGPVQWVADSTDPTLQRSKFERFRPGVQIGGPLWRDHLFFYGSANFNRVSEKERVNQFGSTPTSPAENPLPDADTNTDEYFGKLTANPTSSILIDASYRYRDIDSTNSGISSRAAASTGINGKTEDRVGVVSGLWTITPTWSVEAKYNHNEDNNTIDPVLDLGYQPTFDPTAPYLAGTFRTSITGGVTFIYPPAGDVNEILGGAADAQNDQDFLRNEYRLSSSILANFLGATHDIRFGVNYSENEEDLTRTANGWGSIIATTSSNCGPASPCFRGQYYPRQPAQISEATTWGIFVQDQMTWKRLTLNLGVLANRDEFIPNDGGDFIILRGDFTIPNGSIPTCDTAPDGAPACTYLDTQVFDFGDEIQPRIGIAYEVDPRAHDKFYANYARYYNMDNQSFSRAAAPIRLFRRDAYFDRTTGALITEVVRTNQVAKRVLEHMDPTKTDEVLFGYARPLGGGWAAELWGMYRYTDDIIEDFPGFNRDSDSPGNFRYGNVPGHRKYRAATIEVRRAYSDRWTLDVSYTLSRLEGNWDVESTGSSIFYTSSYIEDGPGLYTTDPIRNGILIGDRTHVGKIFASYDFPTNTTVGAYLRYQSGRPWEAHGYDPANEAAAVLMYLEKAGSRRLESWTNFDLQITQRIPLRPVEIVAGVRIGNVFNEQPVLDVDKAKFSDTANTVPNPNFGKPTLYASPRRFTLVAGVTF
jgi:Carboxypeptidase regulatory-like domain